MARIEWVKWRLDNWALWKVREHSGGLGYTKQAVFLSVVVDRYREAVMPVNDVDAEQTNRAVESLRESGREQLYLTLQWLYVQGLGIKATAREMGRAESTVHAHLDQADHALAAWFAAQAGRKSLST